MYHRVLFFMISLLSSTRAFFQNSLRYTSPTSFRLTHRAMASSEYPTQISDDERYLFDLNGFIVVRNVLTPEEVKEANDAIDERLKAMIERKHDALRNAVKGTAFYGSGPGRKDLGGVLEWGEESKVFKSILAHPRLVPLFHGILGKGYRMDHLPFVIAQDQGAEGFQLRK